ncbi:HNH endonuclease signature motif containing protein [Nocardioides sp. SYSU D00065]|uniref:HNH endonuclease signature motif containing protein n=1 Tax=Nocardioides sp. SYSU D00065 TaxID=2817378 RepID=UPI001B30B92A|nr:HNH endonuclease signature motif containing protein [Nocardioides sp. SYSU D00065]
MEPTTAADPQVIDLPDLTVLAEGALLAEAVEVESVLREAEVHKLRIAYQWAVAHPTLDGCETPTGAVLPAVLEQPETLGGAGTPAVAAFTPEPLAVALGCSPAAAASLLADTLDLHHRLPLLWDQTRAQLVPVWKARRVAARTRHLSLPAAGWVDRQVAGRVSSLGVAALDRLVAEAAARCDNDNHSDHSDLAEREDRARAGWDVVLVHPDPHRCAGTSQLHAVGDTLDLTRFHDVVCAEADALAALGDTDDLGARKAKALGVIADTQARLDLTTLLPSLLPDTDTDTTLDPVTHEQARHHAARHQEARRRAMERRDAKVRLYLHASLADVLADVLTTDTCSGPAVGTVESLGPVTLDRIRDWAGRSRVTIQPVLHVAADDRWSTDRHDPPPRMAEQVRLRDETCVFPWCTRPSRQCDLDHRHPYLDPDDGGPPGQTAPATLAPLCRRHHRAKTAPPLDLRTHQPRHLPVDRTRPPHRPRHPTRHRPRAHVGHERAARPASPPDRDRTGRRGAGTRRTVTTPSGAASRRRRAGPRRDGRRGPRPACGGS